MLFLYSRSQMLKVRISCGFIWHSLHISGFEAFLELFRAITFSFEVQHS